MSTEQLEAERSSSAGPGTGPAELPSVPDTESRPAAAAESTVIPAPPKGAELLIRLLQAAGYTTSASLMVDQLLDRFGTVRAVLDAPRDALAATLEWDANVIPLLEAARHLVDNLQNAELPRRYRIGNSDDLLKYVEQTKRPSCPGVRLLLWTRMISWPPIFVCRRRRRVSSSTYFGPPSRKSSLARPRT